MEDRLIIKRNSVEAEEPRVGGNSARLLIRTESWMTTVVLLARAAFTIPRTEAETQQRKQRGFSWEAEK